MLSGSPNHKNQMLRVNGASLPLLTQPAMSADFSSIKPSNRPSVHPLTAVHLPASPSEQARSLRIIAGNFQLQTDVSLIAASGAKSSRNAFNGASQYRESAAVRLYTAPLLTESNKQIGF